MESTFLSSQSYEFNISLEKMSTGPVISYIAYFTSEVCCLHVELIVS